MHFSVNILITINSETKFYSISSVVEDLCVFVAAFKFFVPYATTPITFLQDLILKETLPNSCFFFFQVTTYTCVMIFRHFYLKRNSIFKPNLHQDAHPTKKNHTCPVREGVKYSKSVICIKNVLFSLKSLLCMY